MAQPTHVSDAAHPELIPIQGAIETAVTHDALIADTQGNDAFAAALGLSARPVLGALLHS